MEITALPILVDANEAESHSHPSVNPPRACASCFGELCPFAELKLQGEEKWDGSGDEHYFRCRLLGDEEVSKRRAKSVRFRDLVWGENPVCTSADWVARIKAELAEVGA